MTDIAGQPEGDAFYAQVLAMVEGGELSAALALAEQALADGHDQTEAVCVLAALSFRTGSYGTAIKLIRDTLEAGEFLPDLPNILATLYCCVGLLSNALYYGKEATIVPPDGRIARLFGPDLPDFAHALAAISHKPLMRLGCAAIDDNRYADAIHCFEQHLMVDSGDVEVVDHYARVLQLTGQTAKALGLLRSLTTLGGQKPTLMSRTAACLSELGRLDQALVCHRAAVTAAPKALSLWGRLVSDLTYVPDGRSDAIELTQRWAQAVEANSVKSPRAAPALVLGERVSLAMLVGKPLDLLQSEMIARFVNALDKKRFNVIALGNGELDARHNLVFRSVFAQWRNVADLDVLTLGALVRGESVAALIDADGLNQPERAGLFLRNCAPIQAAWLNAPEFGPVPGATMHLVAKPSGLPGELLIPGGRYLYDVTPLPVGPSLRDDAETPFTFGADVTLAGLSPDTVALWAAVLNAAPDSVILLRNRGQFADQDNVAAVIDLFGNFGVAHRIEVASADIDLVEFCRQVDVMLAPVPAVDALAHGRMIASGLPVVVMDGKGGRADLAAALAGTEVGAIMVASDAAGYVDCALTWKNDRGRRALFRAQPKSMLSASPAFSCQLYAERFSAALLGRMAELAG